MGAEVKKTHPQLGTPIHAALAALDATASCPGLRRPPLETQPQGRMPSLAPPRHQATPTSLDYNVPYHASALLSGGGPLRAESK